MRPLQSTINNLLRKISFFLVFSILGISSAYAQVAWPKAQTIRFIVPFTPGSGTDVIARLLANRLAETLQTSIFVENKPGAGGTIGAAIVAKAEPNGYTF